MAQGTMIVMAVAAASSVCSGDVEIEGYEAVKNHTRNSGKILFPWRRGRVL